MGPANFFPGTTQHLSISTSQHLRISASSSSCEPHLWCICALSGLFHGPKGRICNNTDPLTHCVGLGNNLCPGAAETPPIPLGYSRTPGEDILIY